MPYLEVPGACLYYEVTGTGPLLLLIPGGTDDSRDFAAMTEHLQRHYTVLSYDGRGMSRSRLDGEPEDVPVETLADDACRLLRVMGDRRPAYVFGTSSGGQAALALVARHPGMVRLVVAHEPPAAGLLADDDPRRSVPGRVRATYLERGVPAAMEVFIVGNGLVGASPLVDPPESDAAAAEMRARQMRIEANLPLFLAHVIEPASSYMPDLEAIGRLPGRVVVGVGRASRGQMAHDAGVAVACVLQTEVVRLPGGHAGFVSHPEAFAWELRGVLCGGNHGVV